MTTNYIGNELELFQHAVNWKKYFSSFLTPYIRGHVAEVGAGIGANVPYLINASVRHYLCIEPDEKSAAAVAGKIATGELPAICAIQQGYLEEAVYDMFDAILYIDVLEHIEDDAAEVRKAINALKPGGALCIVVPANPNDYTAFDKAIGHFRRYTRGALLKIIQQPLQVDFCYYLDALGSFTSSANKLFLKQAHPDKKQILFWDKMLVPVSRIIDRPFGFRFGKSLVLVAKKPLA